MKTPLTVIISCAGVALIQLHQNYLDESTERNLDDIQREAVLLNLITNADRQAHHQVITVLARVDEDFQTFCPEARSRPDCKEFPYAVRAAYVFNMGRASPLTARGC